jgi:murein DD-endopeptidase MepM/ murein hydrolase activator NlpD
MLALFAALACSLATQNCPSGQFCNAPFHPDRCPDAGTCQALPASPAIELSLPIPAGEAIYCAKGALAHPGTHDACYDNARFALDLATPASEPPHLIVAAADGTAYFWNGCSTSDVNHQSGPERCNDGWGNYVRIEHESGVFTHYAHLSAVLVNWGEPVRRGQPIGVEGNTGAAGAKHVHFSLHVGDPLVGGPSVPMKRLKVRGGVISQMELRCGDWTRSNEPRAETRQVSDTPLSTVARGFRFEPSLAGLYRMAAGNAESRRRVIPILRRLTGVQGRYWLASALQADRAFAESSSILRSLVDEKQLAWVAKWARLRLAEIALDEGRKADAEKDLRLLQSEGGELGTRLEAARARLK